MSSFSDLKHPKKRAFLAAYSECGDISGAAAAAGISRELHYDWKAKDEPYRAAFALAEELAGDALEDEAKRRAFAGSDKMLMFLLRGLKSEKYGTRVNHEHAGAGGGPVEISVKFV